MADTDSALVGRHRCGCVTLAIARPEEHWDSADDRLVSEFVRDGGEIIRTTVGEARAMPNFLPGECPHEPRGWVREPRRPKVRLRQGYKGCWYVSRDWDVIGSVQRTDGRWWVTPKGVERPLADGGHRTRREAVDALCAAVPVEEVDE